MVPDWNEGAGGFRERPAGNGGGGVGGIEGEADVHLAIIKHLPLLGVVVGKALALAPEVRMQVVEVVPEPCSELPELHVALHCLSQHHRVRSQFHQYLKQEG